MTAAATVGGDDPIRLFLALELPDTVACELGCWSRREIVRGRPVEGYHVTLAFLGRQPRSMLPAVVDLLRHEARASGPIVLEPARYRETRSVGMLVLGDRDGVAGAFAGRLHDGLEKLGVYRPERRPWLPHVTVVRFRERPRLRPGLPALEPFVPSGAAAFLSRLHPSGARYEILESCSLGKREEWGG